MSIVALSKITLCGLSADEDAVLEDLQRLGCLHLIPLQTQTAPETPETALPSRADDAYKALRYLTDVRSKRRQVRDATEFDFDRVVQQALNNKQRRRDTEDRRDFLIKRIQELTPWGDFSLPVEGDVADYRLWFYRVPHQQLEQLQALDLPWLEVHRDQRFAYVAVIAEQEPPAQALPVPRTHTGAVPLETLQHQLEATEIELEELDADHHLLSRWIFLLSQSLAHAEDQAALTHARMQTMQQDGIFMVQGWFPTREMHRLDAFVERHGLALQVEPPGDDEMPPTLLDNPPTVSGGQDLVSFYETPGYRSWDPSTIVFLSFALFFAMILADAGYALVLGGIVAYYWKRMGQSETGKRFRVMAAWGLGASVVYGMLVGSYFGISPPEGSLLARVNVLDLNDFDTMMRLSIVIGCLHLGFANAMAAYYAHSWPARARALGWIAVIFGGLLFWLGSGDNGRAMMHSAGIALLVGGLAAIALLGSTRKVDSLKAALLRLLDGLSSLTSITKMFGDVLSYLRLFALGLASASLAVTFNQLAGQVHDAVPGLGLLLSLMVLLLGHGINLGLGIVSGFVHGLRLNFIEFFNWGIEEEGPPFRAFAKKEIEP